MSARPIKAYHWLACRIVGVAGAETAVSLRNILPMEPSIGIFFACSHCGYPAHD
jgi:hypothetical protein